MTAEDTFGIGRSWVGLMLQKSLQGHVGKGTSAELRYNDWAGGIRFLIVDEAKDVTLEDFWYAYETFKQRIYAARSIMRPSMWPVTVDVVGSGMSLREHASACLVVACTVSRITRYVAGCWQRWIYWSGRGSNVLWIATKPPLVSRRCLISQSAG